MKRIIIKSLALALLTPAAAFATTITGELTMGGDGIAICHGGGACNLSNADGLEFTTPLFISGATGDFELDGLGFGSTGTIFDFDFNPTFVEVNPLWVIDGDANSWSFALSSLSIVDQNSNFLSLSGAGLVSGAGFDDTLGQWSLSANNNSGSFDFTFSSTTTAPEPGILLLLGMGLIGGLGVRRIKR